MPATLPTHSPALDAGPRPDDASRYWNVIDAVAGRYPRYWHLARAPSAAFYRSERTVHPGSRNSSASVAGRPAQAHS